ncbi:MAG: EscU/YscU/HrcU family type III secretion system export apparatus switch protein [Pseudomonadota bacterium]
MADKDKGGDKTELPTPKKLKDARKKGDIAKAQEITSTLGTFGALILLLVAGGWIARTIADFGYRIVTQAASGDFSQTLGDLAAEGVVLFLMISAAVLIPLAALGGFSEVLQTRGLFAPKRLEPKLDNINPISGLKRIFGKQGLVELVKTLAKVAVVICVVWLVSYAHIERMGAMLLPAAQPVWHDGLGADAGSKDAYLTFTLALQVLAWVGAVFIGIALIDHAWSKKRFIKKMMMSRRDIKQEVKQDEGDPHIKGHRRQLGQEWAQSGAVSAAGDASALLVNPTHLAIALDYDAERSPVPVILARGEGEIAEAMRAAAKHAEVPIIRHIPTARKLWARGEVGEMVPEDLFDAIAEVILWAKRARSGKAPMECELEAETPDTSEQEQMPKEAAEAEPV